MGIPRLKFNDKEFGLRQIDDDLFEGCYIEERLADEYDEWQEELEAEKELRDED